MQLRLPVVLIPPILIDFKKVFDENSFFEIHGEYGKSAITGMASLEGFSVGVIACVSSREHPLRIPDIKKIMSLIQLAESSQRSLAIFVDSKSLAPSVGDIEAGIVGYTAKLIEALSKTKQKKVTIIVGDAFGSSYLMLASKCVGIENVYAWNSAKIGVMDQRSAKGIFQKGNHFNLLPCQCYLLLYTITTGFNSQYSRSQYCLICAGGTRCRPHQGRNQSIP